MSEDPHASERIGPSCSKFQGLITLSQLVAIRRGAGWEDVLRIQATSRPLVEKCHGRNGLHEWMLKQVAAACFGAETVSYPAYLMDEAANGKIDMSTDDRGHARDYLTSVLAGNATPPDNYFRLVLSKDKGDLEGVELSKLEEICKRLPPDNES